MVLQKEINTRCGKMWELLTENLQCFKVYDKKIHAKILEHSRIKYIVLFIFNKLNYEKTILFKRHQ